MKSKPPFQLCAGHAAARIIRTRYNHRLRRMPLPRSVVLAFAACVIAPLAPATTITWIGGNVDWVDGTGTANWSPADEPDSNDDAVFNTANTLNLGSNNAILNLALSGGISLNTNDFDLVVDGILLLADSSTDLTIGGSASSVSVDFATINSGGRIFLDGGALRIADEAGAGLLDINAGGLLSGQGTIHLDDALAAATALITNDGTLAAAPPGLLVVGMPAAGSLVIPAANSFARVDLDGTSGSGTVNVGRNQLLDINVALFDSFSGDLNLSHRSTIDVSTPWTMSSGSTVDIDNGAITGLFPIAADTSFIAGADFTQAGGTLTVIDADGALQFNAAFTQTGGDLVNNGLVVFNANATIGSAAKFTMPADTSSLTVNPAVVVNIDQPDFNADGTGFTTNVITVGSGGTLDLDLGTGADTSINATLRLNGGIIDVTTNVDSWSIAGPVTVGADTGTSQINGEPVTFAGSAVTLGANAALRINAASTLSSTAAFAVAAGATLGFPTAPIFSGASFAGDGILRVEGSSQVTANTTIGVHAFDWDWNALGENHRINSGVTFTINSPVLLDAMDDAVTLMGTGSSLIVNGPAEWNMNGILNSNPAAATSAVVGGTSRIILGDGINANSGTTAVTAPITFDAGSITTVAAGASLNVSSDAVYSGGTITGAGNYRPPSGLHNTVTADSTISTAELNFDFGSWVVQPGAQLTLNVGDYDSDTATNTLDNNITLNSGFVDINTGDAVFIMNGFLRMNNTSGMPWWSGEAIQIGNDAGTLDAGIQVTGAGYSGIYSPVVFQSDADVNIAAGSTLGLYRAVTFQSVNGAEIARFTGSGTLITSAEVHYNEATTLNLTGGRIDLDGSDSSGDTHYVIAPLTINAATLDAFGRTNTIGTNIIDVNSWTGSGSLTVNLDNPATEWTLNGPGLLRLLNDPTAAAALTLLAGSDVNLAGTVHVIGDVRTTSRVHIGGTVEIQTAAKPFRLSGGDLTDVNTLVGGTINGPGILGADNLSSLFGHGTINSNIDFDSNADLLADNGTLTINGSVLDARYFGTNDADGILEVTNAWNSNTVTGVSMNGGELKGGILTNDGAGGIAGYGLVSSRVNNNSLVSANNGATPLIAQTSGNDNDWDGTSEAGRLQANTGGLLEIRDNQTFLFNGTLNALNGGTVFANGFALYLQTASTLSLTNNGTFKQSAGILNIINGTVTIGAGTSTLRTEGASGGFSFSGGSATLTGHLQLDNPLTVITNTATFSGAGRLINLPGRLLAPTDTATINVLVENRGILAPGGGTGIARNDMRDFVQTATGNLEINLDGSGVGSFDRLIVDGNAQLAGNLQLSLGGGFVPALNDILPIVSATAGVTGAFAPLVQPVGMPTGLVFEVIYNPTTVQLKVVSESPFDNWINAFGIADPTDRTKGANPDSDQLNNLGEFATDGDPTSGASSGKIIGKIARVDGADVLTLTLPVRNGTVTDPADAAGGELGLKQTADGLYYKIQASHELGAWTLTVTEVSGPDAAAIQLGMPPLNPGWTYRTFRSPGTVAGAPLEFMRVKVSD